MHETFRVKIFLVLCSLLISCKIRPAVPSIGYKFKLYDNGDFLSIVDSNNIAVVYGPILSFDFDSTFIIAMERPQDSVPGFRTLNLKEYEKAFSESHFCQFWILDNTKQPRNVEPTEVNKSVYGPLNFIEYKSMRIKLGVPENLKLKTE